MTPDTELSLGVSCQRPQMRCSRRQPSLASRLSPGPPREACELKGTLCEGKPSVAICAVVSLGRNRSRIGSFVFPSLSSLFSLFVSSVLPLPSSFPFSSGFSFLAPLVGCLHIFFPSLSLAPLLPLFLKILSHGIRLPISLR